MITPKQIRQEQFGSTQFKRGYAEQDVDDFLDRVAITIEDLMKENEGLKVINQTRAIVAAVPTKAIVVEKVPDTADILRLAQTIHDQHIADGELKKAKLIAEGQYLLDKSKNHAYTSNRASDRMIEETRERSVGIIAEANKHRSAVEHDIKSLNNAKSDAHEGMRIYLEEQLKALDNSRPEYT